MLVFFLRGVTAMEMGMIREVSTARRKGGDHSELRITVMATNPLNPRKFVREICPVLTQLAHPDLQREAARQ
jgi:hypothetical protein